MTKNGNNLRRDSCMLVYNKIKSALISSLATELCQLSQTADTVF